MRANLLLFLCSVAISVGIGLVGYRWILDGNRPAGSTFESIDDLRSAIKERDERDVRSDRSVSFRSIIKTHPSDLVIYELAPNLDVRFQRVAVQTNSYGMRSPEYPPEKSEKTYRIAILGDSYAFGWGVEQDKIFPAVLEDILNKQYSEHTIEVLNFGVPGYSTFQQVTQFLEKGMAFQPDLVLVFFVNNDFGLPFFIKEFENPDSLIPSAKFSKLQKAEKDEAIKQRNRKFLNSINPNTHLKRLADEMEQRDIPVFISMNPRRSSHIDEGRLPILKQHKNLKYIPIKKRYLEIMDERGLKRDDVTLKHDMHPNAIRHGIYGEILAALLSPLPGLEEIEESS